MCRVHLARAKFRREMLKVAGRSICAARVIMRAWINFRDGRRFYDIIHDWRIEHYNSLSRELRSVRESIVADTAEIRTDIEYALDLTKRTKSRSKDLKDFTAKAEMRLHQIHVRVLRICRSVACSYCACL
jgi:hypothetical protein